MNDHTFQKLEFDLIRELLAGYCATNLGKSLARAMTPSIRSRVVEGWLVQVDDLLRASVQFGFPPLAGVYDIRDSVRASAFPTPLEASHLSKIADTLSATAHLYRWFNSIASAAPSLQSLSDRIHDLSPIALAIQESIDERGEVRDYASPRLATIRRTIEEAKDRIKVVFDRLLRQSSTTKFLQYSAATFHNDRFVLPLKAEYRGRIDGIVHRSSDSGATLFIEPAESVELNNTIVRLRDEENREITQILRGLSQRVQLNAREILNTLGAISILDLVAAKCRYAQKRNCICPEVSPDGPTELHDGRHPLLVEMFAAHAIDNPQSPIDNRQVVPIDLRLGDDFDVLVITGPNTGGKTVALKTIGLLALMTQCGMPIPAGKGTKMPVFQQIFIDIGDEQSLQQSLSTFSSHLATLLDILRHGGTRSLVLIDELGAGTDPDEGAAIGQAVISELLNLKAKAVLTTHLSSLKAVAYTTPRVDNASVEFDPETLRPTFRLRLGEPGNSNALIIAKRLGMPARLVQKAKQYLDDRSRQLSKAIAGTIESRREAEAARKIAHDAALAAQREKEKYEQELRELHESQEAFDRWTQWIEALRPGDEVFAKPVNRNARVVRMQLHKQTAVVSSRGMDIEVPIRDLSAPQIT